MNRRKIELFAIIFAGILGLSAFIFLYDKANPQSSLKVNVNRNQATQTAKGFLGAEGFDINSYKETTVFVSDEEASVYLQKTQGIEKTSDIAQNGVPLWFWTFRAFKPLEKEEFLVDVDPSSGKITNFSHLIEDDKEGATIEQEEAEKIARDFVQNKMGIDLVGYERVEASSEKMRNRTDHHFEWKKKDFSVGEGELRLSVDVLGDKAETFGTYLKVPETFQRGYQKEISTGELLSILSLVMMFFIAIAAFIVFIKKYKSNDIKWKFGLIIAIIFLVLLMLDAANNISTIKMSYTTEVGYSTFWIMGIAAVIVGSVVYGLLIMLTGSAGDALTREVYPQSIGLFKGSIKQTVFSREFSINSFLGYFLAFFFLGYASVFYSIALKYLHVWTSAEGPMNEIFNSYFPFLFPLLIGFTAAVSEEFMFRFFAIPFLKKYLRYTFLALLIPAIIWAFGHSNYPVYPVYVRGIELTLAGLAFGWVFIRFGLWPCLVAHYVIDAVLVSMPLLKSSNKYYIVSGAFIILLALIPAIVALLGMNKTKMTEQDKLVPI
jgi:hypothetical protein